MFTDRHRRVLQALCDAFVRSDQSHEGRVGLDSIRASDLDAAAAIEKALEKLPSARQRTFQRLLRVVDHPVVTFFWRGRFIRFSRLPAGDASSILKSLSSSRIAPVRRAFGIVKRVVLLHSYGSEAAMTAVWQKRGYLPIRSGVSAERIGASSCPDSCEILVIGSGAGGAVAAAALAKEGREVVVVEKGPEVSPSAMDGIETSAMGEMFEQGGLMTTADGSMSLFAGSCLGGGTTVNWSASFRLPDEIRYEWHRLHGIDWLESSEIDQAYDAVEDRTEIGVDEADDNGPNAALRRGCHALGLEVRRVPRNTKGCSGDEARRCGRCGLGCAWNRKQGGVATFLRDVRASGGKISTGATVTRILTDGGSVRGAELEITDSSGTRSHVIRAERIVLAAGSLHTPVILRRSGFLHAEIGRNLHLHPTVGVAGCYAEHINGWEGPIMSSFSPAFAAVEGPWGVRLETPPLYPGLFASALPWHSAKTHKGDLDRIESTAAFIVLTRDRSSGAVSPDSEGFPKVQYRMNDDDIAMMLTGVIEAARIHLSAGAESVLFPHSERKILDVGGKTDRIADLAREIFGWNWSPGLYPLFSAHQMGTCRMGGNTKRHPVDPEGRLREIRGLYVCDASLFPEASGVNPALTVQAMARVVASRVR